MPEVNQFTIEAAVISDGDFAGLDIDLGASIYETQKFKAAKLGKRGMLVFVDSELGSDATGLRGRADRPFLTLTAAKTAASSGDTIVVRPGTYDENNLLKTGVNWWFYPDASVVYTGVVADAIFDDFGIATVSQVFGYGNFQNADSGQVIFISNAVSDLQFNGVNISSDTGVAVRVLNGTLNLDSKTISSTSSDAINISGGTVTIQSNSISSGGIAVNMSGGTLNLDSKTISSTSSDAINISGGGTAIQAGSISAIGIGDNAIVVSGGGTQIVKANSISSINGTGIDASGASCRIYADTILGGDGPAVLIGASILTVHAVSITALASSAIVHNAVALSVFRVVADEIRSLGFAAVNIVAAGSGIFNIGSWVGASAISIDVGSMASLTVENGALGTGIEDGGITVNSATALLTLLGARVDGVISLPAGMNDLTIKDCIIVTTALNSIIGAGACNVKLYGRAMSNKATDGNITFITGAADFEVDTDVIFV